MIGLHMLKTALCRTMKGESEATGAYHTTRCKFAPVIKIQFNLIGLHSFKICTATVTQLKEIHSHHRWYYTILSVVDKLTKNQRECRSTLDPENTACLSLFVLHPTFFVSTAFVCCRCQPSTVLCLKAKWVVLKQTSSRKSPSSKSRVMKMYRL